MNKLFINGLNLNIAKQSLISSIKMELEGGKAYALIGPNGAGKTTLLKTLAGLLPVSANNVFINNLDLFFLPLEKRAKIISLLLQHSPYDPYTLGIDRIAQGLIPINGILNHALLPNQIAINKMVQTLNINHLLTKWLMHMSGGEQRLIYLAKSLINQEVQLFLLDEPTIYLDFRQKKNLSLVLQSIKQEGKIIIFSCHDQSFINEVATEALIIENNKIQGKLIAPTYN